MDFEKIERILQSCLQEETEQFAYPTAEDWESLEKKLNCRFCAEFISFINLMSKYKFPGDIYNVKNDHNGNDMILDVYQYECQYPEWDENMVPFYEIGNGDYFCIHKENNKVYYFYADSLEFELYMDTFSEWILNLPDFLE